MSVHRSLKTGGALIKHRNVLKRTERLERLEEEGKWSEDKDSVLSLPKVRNIKLKTKKKSKKDEAEGDAAAEGTAAAPAT